MIEIAQYESNYKSLWNDFVKRSKNGSFLFCRDYMEYHADTFSDSSLLFFEEGDLVAIMPANTADNVVYSHGGLTFGGIVSGPEMRIELMLHVFASLTEHLREQKIRTVIYKPVPHIYHVIPAEEDLYALFRHNAQLVRRDASTAVLLDQRIPFSRGKKRRIQLGKRNEIVAKRTDDFRAFMEIVTDILARKYSVAPTHTANEMELLSKRFPENIKLFAAYKEGIMLAGVAVYDYKSVAHAQYIASSEEGQKMGAGELIMDYLIDDYSSGSSKRYFDFGISTEQGGRYLNAGLSAHKEGFGGRTITYDAYEVDVANTKPSEV